MAIYKNVRNAKYIEPTNTIIDCEIEHKELGWIPYTLHPDDPDMTVDNTELLAELEVTNAIAAYVPPTTAELEAKATAEIYSRRAAILANAVDPLVTNPLRWDSLTSLQQTDVKTYRQQLLDITLQAGYPLNVTWPTAPDWM